MNADQTLSAIALVERMFMQDGAAVAAMVATLPVEDWPHIAGCLATILSVQTEQVHGITGAAEVIDGWRNAALAGARDAT